MSTHSELLGSTEQFHNLELILNHHQSLTFTLFFSNKVSNLKEL